MSLSLSSAFTESHRFWVVVFSFSLVSMHILISFFISSVISWLFRSMEEIKKEIKICIETNENESTTTQNLFDSVKAKGKVHSNTSLSQKTREKSNNQPNSTPKASNKRRNEEPQA